MSGRRNQFRERRSTQSKATPPQDATSRPKSSKTPTTEVILDECIAAISFVDVSVHALEAREIASAEQEVLKRALRVLWFIHDWIDDLDNARRSDRSHRGIEP